MKICRRPGDRRKLRLSYDEAWLGGEMDPMSPLLEQRYYKEEGKARLHTKILGQRIKTQPSGVEGHGGLSQGG